MAARIEPGDLEVDLADAQPGEVLDAAAHVRAQVLDGGGQWRGEDQAEVEVEAVDVANASLFLASDEARYITSVSLPVDAGSTQR